MSDKDRKQMQRRTFLKAAAASTAFTILPAAAARGYETNSKIELGMVGCGSRGIWIGRLFEQHANVKIVAAHDYFRDRTEDAQRAFDVDPTRCHIGLDGYQELIAGSLDAVAVESPPYYHPEQSVATLDAGKHLFLAKPIAVDVPGCMAIVEAAKRNSGKLSAWVDFQTRVDEHFMEAARLVHDGFIGAPVCGQFYYYCGRLGKRCEGDSETSRLRNWMFDIALSGDIIVEQNIHVIDVANWYLQGHPVKAVGTGGRKARTDVGDCWDHFAVVYTYPDDVIADFSSGQFTYGYDDLCMRLFCDEGTLDSHYGGDVWIRGRSNAWPGGKTSTIFQDGAIANIKLFCDSITENAPIDNTVESAESTMASILGRMAAYSGEEITWDEMMAKNEALELELNLPEDGPEHPPVRA